MWAAGMAEATSSGLRRLCTPSKSRARAPKRRRTSALARVRPHPLRGYSGSLPLSQHFPSVLGTSPAAGTVVLALTMPHERPSLRWLGLLLLLSPATHAHMELVSPYAMWSKSDPQVTEDQKCVLLASPIPALATLIPAFFLASQRRPRLVFDDQSAGERRLRLSGEEVRDGRGFGELQAGRDVGSGAGVFVGPGGNGDAQRVRFGLHPLHVQ